MSSDVHDLVLFDLDGTLTDSAPGIVNCIRYALDRMGIDHPDDATMRTFLGPPLAVTFGQHFSLSGPEVEQAISLYRERYHDIGLFENDVYDGVRDLLTAVDDGRVLAVATSKPTYSAARILEHFDLADHFAFIGGADLDGTRHDKASVIAHTLESLRRSGHDPSPSRTVMIGDREHDVHGARVHAIDTIGVLWGYGDEGELLGAGAIALAGTPADLELLLS